MPPTPAPAVSILRPGDESRLEAFLRPRLDSSMILLSNLRKAGIADRGGPFEGTYYRAPAGGEIAGVAAHYWQGNLILQAPDHLDELVETISSAPVREVRGLLGPGDQVGRARRLLGWPDARIQLDEREGLYALPLAELVVPQQLGAGSVTPEGGKPTLRGRRAERRDLDRVAAWRVDYCLEALGAEETPELRAQCRAEMEGYLERGETWVLEDSGVEGGGVAVASTSFNATIREAVQVGGVWTPPELRGRGYGRAAVAASLLDARAEGVERAILFTGDDNVPAVKAYAALGFRRVGDHRVVLLRA